jgi:hypothetical protein
VKLYPKRGFEFAADGNSGLWCPSLTGGTGYQVFDSNFGTVNTGTATGYTDAGSPWIRNEQGNSLDFNGASNHVVIDNSRSLNFSASMSLAFWVKTGANVSSLSMLAAKAIVSPAQISYRVWIQTSRLNFQISRTGSGEFGQRQSSILNPNTTYFFAVRFQGSRVQDIFLNGVLDNAAFLGTIRPSCFVGQTPLIIGAQAETSSTISAPFLGQMAEVCTWNRALTVGEIRTLYEAGPGGAWQLEPVRRVSYFAQTLPLPVRRRSSRFLTFPG